MVRVLNDRKPSLKMGYVILCKEFYFFFLVYFLMPVPECFEYFNIVSVNNIDGQPGESAVEISASPNPFYNELRITINSA